MESERLFFKEIDLTDTEFIVNIRSNPQVYQYFIHPHRVTTEEHVHWFRNSYLTNQYRTDYIAVEKNASVPIGVFGLIISGDVAEINYIIREESQRKGFASEGINYLLSYAHDKLSCMRGMAEIHEENIPSLSLAKKLGFSEVGKDGKIIRFEKRL